MTILEKKQTLKRAVDALPEAYLDEALLFIKSLGDLDKSRKVFTQNLLKKEESLFKRLAQ